MTIWCATQQLDLPCEHAFLPSTVFQEEANAILSVARRMQALHFDVTSSNLKGRFVLDEGVCSSGKRASICLDVRSVGVILELPMQGSN